MSAFKFNYQFVLKIQKSYFLPVVGDWFGEFGGLFNGLLNVWNLGILGGVQNSKKFKTEQMEEIVFGIFIPI